LLQHYPEHNGPEPVYIAVTTDPLHWRIVWRLYQTENGSNFQDGGTDTTGVGWKVLEVVKPTGTFQYRCSYRRFEGSALYYQLFFVGDVDAESRGAIAELMPDE